MHNIPKILVLKLINKMTQLKENINIFLSVKCVLLFQANLPYLFWNFTIQHVTFLINCIPHHF